MNLCRWLSVPIAATALLAGCGASGSDETEKRPIRVQPLHLTLDGEVGPETAGVMTAQELDYFDAAGIDLSATTPAEPSRVIGYVASGSVDLGVSHAPQVVLAREKGAPIVAVGSLVPEPTISMIWLEESKISDIADLKGKTIAYPGVPFQVDLLKAVLARAGLALSDVKLEWAGYDLVPALVNGRADAIFGGSWNVEGVALEARGLAPVITRAPNLGIPPYPELVVIARKDRVAENPALFRRFLAVVRRGTAAAIDDPEAAAEAVYERSFQTVNLKLARAGLEATLPLLSETGRLDPEEESRLIEWMHEQGLIPAKTETSRTG